ncbi:MAG: SNF2-related protein [Gemmataceae bacterium]
METTTPLPEEIQVEVIDIPTTWTVETRTHPRFERPLEVSVRQAPLLSSTPWVRSLGKVGMDVRTQGWKFPQPADGPSKPPAPAKEPTPGRVAVIQSPEGTLPLSALPPEAQAELALAVEQAASEALTAVEQTDQPAAPASDEPTRLRPPRETVVFKDRLLYLLQPPLESLFANGKVTLPFDPFPYQLKGIAFLMPRHHALIADEMGLGKTVQVIVSLRLLFHAGLIRNALVVCPKPLVINWSRELSLWAPDVPFEVIGGDYEQRKYQWHVSNCPVKLVNYELITRDANEVQDERCNFDVVVLDEAQRIKSRDSKTAQVVCGLSRTRSWAMSGTPIENKIDDLINLFNFVDPQRIPPDTPTRMLRELTSDYLLRRTKEMVVSDMPPRIIRDVYLDLSPAQREAYDLAEKEGVIHLNELGNTITVQHVFELVMRLKQICNFDMRTGQSSKLDQLSADMEEVAASNRKAIVFSQWTEPLETLAKHLRPYGPLLYHGKVPHAHRQNILDQFKHDPTKHVILMSYGTGSVGLNLQFTNYVFLFDRWWNPAIEDQAINRAHRLGQKAPVFVSRFISENTIEKRIAEVLDQKRALFNEMIEGNGPPATLGLTEDEVFGLFDIQARPKRG